MLTKKPQKKTQNLFGHYASASMPRILKLIPIINRGNKMIHNKFQPNICISMTTVAKRPKF